MEIQNTEHLVGDWINHPDNVNYIRKIAPTDTIVLITGETGVGKGALANLIVENSKRKDKGLVDINCGAITESLLETTLFGHVKGAFTDAKINHIGHFEEAKGGTIFLDEITETSLNFQTKLLKVLEKKCIRKVGDRKDTPIDVRVIVATNKVLTDEVDKGNFRQDLYYRLNLAEIKIPPLRERVKEIPIFIQHFLEMFGKRQNKNALKIAPETMNILLNHRWIGNIREIKNTIEVAVFMTDSDIILPKHLPEYLRDSSNQPSQTSTTAKTDIVKPIGKFYDFFDKTYSKMINEYTKLYFAYLLNETKGNIREVAKISDLDRKTVYNKIKQFDIEVDSFRVYNRPKYATTFDRIESIMKTLSDIDIQTKEGEKFEDYKKRIEKLYLPLISQLEGVRLEWKVPDYSVLPEELRPKNTQEEVVYINSSESPVNDLIKSVIGSLIVKR